LQAHPEQNPPQTPTPVGSDRKPIRLLSIEDNPLDERLLRERLSAADGVRFEIETTDRFDDGLERLRTGRFDLVLLDLSLPDSEGSQTIARMHQEAPQTPIIALTGLDDPTICASAVKHGAEDYLVKGTFKTDTLIRAMLYAIDRRQARQDLVVARDSALESSRLRSEFLANMSHEIRTPLNGVGMTRLLVDTRLTGDQREMIGIALASAETLLRIVNDILDFSKISAGKMVLEEHGFDVGAVVESVDALFIEQARAKGVAIDSLIENDVPMQVCGDAGRLRQVLTNLVGNAVKFTVKGEVTIRVSTVTEIGNESVLRFQVRDTGIGIPLAGQRDIFSAFTQAEDSTARCFGGTGLGLAISAQLIELMGGSIGVESTAGGGSNFWFTVRLRHQLAAAGATNLENPLLQRVHVLIADGNEASARILCDHFQTWKMRSEVAANSALAMVALNDAIAAGDPFEIAVIDLQVPDSGGLALARAIQQSPQLASIRVVGIHELGDRSAAGRVKAAGIRALITRPLRQSRLYNILVTLMASSPPDGLIGTPPRRRLARPLQSVIPAEIRERTRILLVEDNLVNRQVEIRMIERIGYRTDFVENGAGALERLNHTDYDLILMDCQMPGMDGYAATHEIRRREGATRHTPIIGLTARALAGDRDDCIRAGMDDYLSKPVMPEDLGAIIDKWAMGDARRTLVSEPPTAPIEVVMIAPQVAVTIAPIEAGAVAAPIDAVRTGAPPCAGAAVDGAVLANSANTKSWENPILSPN
jgi:two-component system sensor histidine kinase/response regulator